MKTGTKVILKTQQYEDDKYNPRELVGVVIDGRGRFSPIRVEWSNGIRNAYYGKDLEIVT